MKNLVLGVFAIIFTTTVYSQNKGWSLGLIGSPNFYLIKPRHGSTSYTTNLGLSVGLESIYSFNKRLDLGLGANMTSLGYSVDYNYTFLEPNDPDIPKYGEIRALYVDIPLFVRYNLLLGERITFYPSIAVNSSFLMRSKERITYEDNSTRDENNLRSYIVSLRLGLGLAYKINQKMIVKLEPRLRSYWKGFDQKTDTRVPALFQTVIGIEYKIGKEE